MAIVGFGSYSYEVQEVPQSTTWKMETQESGIIQSKAKGLRTREPLVKDPES